MLFARTAEGAKRVRGAGFLYPFRERKYLLSISKIVPIGYNSGNNC